MGSLASTLAFLAGCGVFGTMERFPPCTATGSSIWAVLHQALDPAEVCYSQGHASIKTNSKQQKEALRCHSALVWHANFPRAYGTRLEVRSAVQIAEQKCKGWSIGRHRMGQYCGWDGRWLIKVVLFVLLIIFIPKLICRHSWVSETIHLCGSS